jgi:hypothetical protein
MTEFEKTTSTPRLTEFDPRKVPFQIDVIKHVRKVHLYNQGPCELMLSGSVGSAKTILAAHLVATHVLHNSGAQVVVMRRTLKDLKATFWRVLLTHFPEMNSWLNKSEMRITLPNGSIIYGLSYDDGRFDKFRSYELSMGVLEEGTECDDSDLYDEVFQRIGRLPHVKENLMLVVTNPGSPSHWLHERFVDKPTPNRKVFYSITEQNPFLPEWYIENLKRSLDPKRAQRMLYGKWIEILSDVIYYNFNSEINFKREQYKWNASLPLDLMFDFNIGLGKPLSCGVGQVVNGHFHLARTFIIEGARTADMCEEIQESGIVDMFSTVRLYGDASGSHKDTRNTRSDWDIIKKAFQNYKTKDNRSINVEYHVPLSNPPIRARHNLMNTLFKNTIGQVRFTVWKDAQPAEKGLRLTAFKKGGFMIEDDSLAEQHITTAIGYWCYRIENVKPLPAVNFG